MKYIVKMVKDIMKLETISSFFFYFCDIITLGDNMSYLNNNTIGIINDYVMETRKKHPDYSQDRINGAFKQFLKNFDSPKRADGFSRINGSRDALNSLRNEDIYIELLKNVIKLKAYRDDNGERQFLGKTDTFSDNMHPLEKDEWLFHQIMYCQLDGINAMMTKNDKILNALINSFVESRYFSMDAELYLANKPNEPFNVPLDDPIILTEEEQDCLDKIDRFYKMGNVYGR